MPFSKRTIVPAAQYARADEKTGLVPFHNELQVGVLDVATATQYSGMLAQLTQLSEYANDIFTNLRIEALSTLKRVERVKTRYSELHGKLATVDYTSLYNRPRGRREDYSAGMQFSEQTRDVALKAAFAQAAPKPNFEQFDRFSDGPCSKKFSDPTFFFNMWVAAEQAKQEELAKKKKSGKKKKKAAQPQLEKKVVAKVQTKVFSAMGAEFQPSPTDTEAQRREKEFRRRESSKQLMASQMQAAQQSGSGTPYQPAAIAEEPANDSSRPSAAPAPPPIPGGYSQAYAQSYAPPAPSYASQSYATQSYSQPAVEIPEAPEIPMAPSLSAYAISAADIPMAPPIPDAPPLPEEMPYQQEEVEAEPSGLQVAISSVQLRKAPPPIPKKNDDPRSQLLDQIRNAKIDKLRKVEVTQKKEEAHSGGMFQQSVKRLMEMRQHIAGSDDESGSDWEE